MTEIEQVNTRFDQLEKQGEEREKKHEEAHGNFTKKLEEISQQNKRQFQMLEPMYTIFTSVKGFNGISVWILKALILIGAGGAVVWGILKWLRMGH